MTPISVASEVGASAVVERPARRPSPPPSETNEQGHPLRMKLTVVEGFRLTEIAALGAAAPRHRHSGRLRWVGLLSWRHRRGLRS